ncbi:hypothetical protein PN462_13085 [Spirulina sp. CS-785/01]|uniref:hypothetical protein n=1 Tax=Spirulina sp. CS-785/01 TaxID=3021716 RepID=UPI00232B3F73|nr:hypothetical protein [Spirulina sp. CS-785/01]MDB9314039.1 hypothetical protein [Spirulina sp. CS-785/01]
MDEQQNIQPQETTSQPEEIVPTSGEETPDVVNTVEKISGIIAPYFIVLVGLYLYEDNFLFGLLLILLGILPLLRVSSLDIGTIWEQLQQSLGLKKNAGQ